jgi:hypothetical protein
LVDLDDAGGDAYNSCSVRDILNDDRAGTDRRMRADLQALYDITSEAYKSFIADSNAAGEGGGWADVDGVADLAFVIDDGGGVDDDAVGELGIGADDRAGGDDDIAAEADSGGDMTAGVDGVDQLESVIGDFLEVSAAGGVISDGDDRAFDLLAFEFWEEIDLANHRQAADGLAGELGIGIEKTDGLVNACGAEDV